MATNAGSRVNIRAFIRGLCFTSWPPLGSFAPCSMKGAVPVNSNLACSEVSSVDFGGVYLFRLVFEASGIPLVLLYTLYNGPGEGWSLLISVSFGNKWRRRVRRRSS